MSFKTALCVLIAALAVFPPAVEAKARVKRLLKDLETASGTDQIRLVEALGRSRSRDAVDPLLTLLDARRASPRLTAAVVAALGRLGDPRALPPLTGVWDYLNSLRLQGEELPGHLQALRVLVVEAVASVGGEGALAVLQYALDDKDPQVVQKAALGLGRLKDRRAVEALLVLLGREGDAARAAVEALAEIGDPRAAAPLERLLAGEDVEAQAQAAYALERLGRGGANHLQRLLAQESLEPRLRLTAAYHLARLDRREGVEHLVKILGQERSPLRAAAADALGRSGARKAVAPLVETLASPDASLRLMSVTALGRLGGPRAVQALRRMEEDNNPSVRVAARQALSDLGE